MSLLLPAAAAQGALRDLQAHGSDERLWLARVEPQAGNAAGRSPATLFVRAKSDTSWRRLGPIDAPILGLAHRGPQLAILLSNGDWLLTTDSTPTSGLPLPGRAHMVAIGSDAESLWAVGLIGGAGAGSVGAQAAGAAPASRPRSTLPSTAPGVTVGAGVAASSRPARPAAPPPPRLVLYKLGPQEWEEHGSLPGDIPAAEGVPLSLAVVGGKPVVAHKADERVVRVFRQRSRDDWEPAGIVESAEDLQDFKAMQGPTGPVVWTRVVSGPSRMWVAPPGADANPTSYELRDGQTDHAVAFANGALRVLWVEDNKIFDQRLNAATGASEGDPASSPLPAVSIQPLFQRWVQVVLMVALVFAMAATVRRRQQMQDASLDPSKLPLAPFGTRLAAGVIDFLPAVAALWLAPVAPTHPPEIAAMVRLLIALGVYFVLTTLVEVLAGRSLGKMATGLRVVGLDGKPAPVGARVVRNLLRVIDLPTMHGLILFSPLRQRAGDLAAGTLVVASKAAEEAAPAEGEEVAQDPDVRKPSDESVAKPE